MRNKQAILFGSGTYLDPNFYTNFLEEHPELFIIAIDGGFNFLSKMDIMPDLIIGDLDSINKRIIPSDIDLQKFPIKKDKSDTCIALEYLIKNKYKKVYLVGMTSQDRLDHSISNIHLIEKFYKKINIILLNENNYIFALKGPIKYKFNQDLDTLISIIPISKKVKKFSLKGFEYPLNKVQLSRKDTHFTISNRITNKKAILEFKKGFILVDIMRNKERS